ncbi:hypothetical protein BH09ACT8_BH09ACT8_46650 [soil metagenome]
MNGIFSKKALRPLATAAALLAAPIMIALGTATMSHADTNLGNASASTSISHPAFPHQTNAPQPGTSIHHHHQK